MTPCPSSAELDEFLSAALSEARREAVREHVRSCRVCETELDRRTDRAELRQWASTGGTRSAPPVDGPALADVLKELHAGFDALARNTPGATVDATPGGQAATAAEVPKYLGPYRIEAELGRGGMGIVYRAHDEVLLRTVAVKVLRPERADSVAQKHLLREAQIAARFRHDHVVTVHAVATPADGPPYLVMEYLDGPTLAELIRTRGRLEPAEAAAIAVQVAEGLAAAHAAGLIHRDIKPGNILLDAQSGRAKILDFGLARLYEAGAGVTQEAVLAGTPTYMSPEQIQGHAIIDGRTDVYGLGVTLYEALTGEVPFRGTQQAVLRQVLEDEPRPPRRLNDRLPRDLEVVCLKALAKEPAQRYRSARDLADDLRRWQRGEPIRARAVGPVGRSWRWARRNPWPAVLSLGLFAALTSGVGGVFWQWRRAEANASTALAKSVEADRQRGEADENFRTMLQVVDKYLVQISENRLLNEPGMQSLRKDLLQTARGFYQRFVESHRDNVVFRAERARALQRLGNLTSFLEGPAKAIEFYEQALAIQEELIREQPDVAAHYIDLGFTWNNLGIAQEWLGKLDHAETAYRKVLELSAHDTGGAFRLLAARGHINLGKVLGQRLRLKKGIAEYERARDISQQLVHDRQELPDSQRGLAISYNNLGDMYRLIGESGRAEQSLRQAVAVWGKLLDDNPRDLQARDERGRTSYNLAWIYLLTDRAARGLEECRRSLPAMTELAMRNPSIGKFQQNVSGWQNMLGLCYQRQGRFTEAQAAFDEAIRGADRVAVGFPQLPDVATMRAFYRASAANLLREQGQSVFALDSYEKAAAILRPTTQRKPPDLTVRAYLRWLYHQRAVALYDLGRHADAVADWDRVHALDDSETRHLGALLRADARKRSGSAVPPNVMRDNYEAAMRELMQYTTKVVSFGSEFCTFARACALASGAAAADDRLAAPERERRAADYAARAVKFLQRASAEGFFRQPARRARLSGNGEFDSLRGRGDFQAFCKSVTARKP